jgi:N-methylhydantoinase A/oxoprolinase/acetone carboxylase beta subunit
MTQISPHQSSQGFIIGIDTGGTYTDAVVVDPVAKKVLHAAKALTTKGDYAIGVSEAMVAALQAVSPSDIAMVSVSTTLATNAVVEGHGSAVGVVLIGFDAQMVARTKIAESFPGIEIIAAAGGHDHAGGEVQKFDAAHVAREVQRVGKSVAAYAVASSFGVRNAAHEIAARDVIARETGLPVTLSSDLSTSLDAPRRALTAVLNARLISRITALIVAVRKSMAQLGIAAPLMIVKGDGSLAAADKVLLKPIETVLSGPAASLVGAQWLTGANDLIMSDMGGTTTDIGVLMNGRPQVAEQGAEVGGWRTMVKAIDVKTSGLGGDSEVHIGLNGALTLGPQRAVPVSLIGARFPEVIAMLEGDLADTEGGSLHGKFVLLPFGAAQGDATGLLPREAELLAQIGERPVSLRRLAVSSGAQRSISVLRKKGLIQFASLTPSDVSHVLDLQNNWSKPAAVLAAKLATRFRDMKNPDEERIVAFSRMVWDLTVSQSARSILAAIMPMATTDSAVVDAVCAGKAQLGLVKPALTPSLPIVAVGGPVKVYYGEVGNRLGCPVIFAENCDVANAVGAAAGLIIHRVKIMVEADGKGLFLVQGQGKTENFTSGVAALTHAEAMALDLARNIAVQNGAFEPVVTTAIEKHLLPDARDDEGLLVATITAEASGAPEY